MKAMLMINVPEDFDYRRCSIGGDGNIYYEREGEQRTSIIGNIKNLKPIPTKKLAAFDPNHCDIEEEIKILREIEGYNRCIDEILGGEDD